MISKFIVRVFVTLSGNSTGSFSFSYDCTPVPLTNRQIPDPKIHVPAFQTALEQFLVYVNEGPSKKIKVLYYNFDIASQNDCGYDLDSSSCECCVCNTGPYTCGVNNGKGGCSGGGYQCAGTPFKPTCFDKGGN